MSMGGGAWEAGRTMDRSWVQCVTLTALRVAPNLTELTKKNTTNDQQQHENVMTWLHIMAVKRPNAPVMRLGGYKSPMRETSGQSALSFNQPKFHLATLKRWS